MSEVRLEWEIGSPADDTKTLNCDHEMPFSALNHIEKLPGVTHASCGRYCLKVARGKLFDWAPIMASVEAIIRNHFAFHGQRAKS